MVLYEGKEISNSALKGIIYRYREKLIEFRGQLCEKCEKFVEKKQLHMHHKDRDRWNNCRENVQLLCPKCHMELHSTEIFE